MTRSSTARAFAVGTVATIVGCQGSPDVATVTTGGNSWGYEPIAEPLPSKLDLLFAIDNSPSMVDAQQELARRIPGLLQSLTTPATVDGVTPRPILDIHIGVISTSLGALGTDACEASEADDHAHLLPRAGEANGAGFSADPSTNAPTASSCPTPVVASALTWTFDPTSKPAGAFTGEAGVATLESGASCVVESVGERGCQHPAGLEAIYHFLIDPAPYQTAQATCTPVDGGVNCQNVAVTGIDAELLTERRAFLRLDSVLAVVLVTNKNDASLNPAGANWVFPGLPGGSTTQASQMPRGWGACVSLPDDLEVEDYTQLESQGCFWCGNNPADPNCDISLWTVSGSRDQDRRSLRMFEETHRFGVNGLFSRDRYVAGFTQQLVLGSNGEMGSNGIYEGGQRTANLVIFQVIAGVPSSLVNDATGGPRDLTEADWDKIVSPDHTIRDPHMIESIQPRVGVAPFTPSATPDVDSIPPDFADPINGGDRAIPDTDDLQFACIGVRASSTLDAIAPDCNATTETDRTNPLCGLGGADQPRFKAYPSLRQLRVLHEIGLANVGVETIESSVCDASYAPAMVALATKIQAVMSTNCIRVVLTPDPTTHDVPCILAEVMPTDVVNGSADVPNACEQIGSGLCTPGRAPCRLEPSAGNARATSDPSDFIAVSVDIAATQLTLPVTQFIPVDGTTESRSTPARVSNNGNVVVDIVGADGSTTPHLVCEGLQVTEGRAGISQATSDGCVDDPAFVLLPGIDGGWCYSTDPQIIGDACTRRGSTATLRMLGVDIPAAGVEAFTVCNE